MPGASPALQMIFGEAFRLHQAGKLDQAAPLYQQVLASEPNHSDSLHLLGLAAYQSGRPDIAEGLIRKAIAVNDREAAFYFHLALALQALGRREEAFAGYRQALSLNPDDPDTYNNLGNALAESEKFEDAADSYRRALALQPDNAGAYNNLGNVLWSMGQRDEAESHYRKAVALAPDYATAQNNLGNICREKGALDEALDCYRRVLALTPDNAHTHNAMGGTLWELGRRDDAMDNFRQAVALAPDYDDALVNLGMAYWEKGALEQAQIFYNRVLEKHPDDVALINNAAGLLMAREQAGPAMEMVRRSLALGETRKAKRLFVELVRQSGLVEDNAPFRALMVRALTEPWSRPGKLAQASADLIKAHPVIGPAIARANDAWPRRLESAALLDGDGLAALADDGLLIALLATTPNIDMALERFLAMVRRLMLGGKADDTSLAFHAALAQQCFINEYVWLAGDKELASAKKARTALDAALKAGKSVLSLHVLAVAAYFPLYELPHAEKLLDHQWPAPVEAVLNQQIREPLEEKALRASIARLTPIEDEISKLVQSQYEENPYPRWALMAPGLRENIVSFLTQKFPRTIAAPGREMKEILVAGCGTGHHSIGTAQKFGGESMLAVDLSLASLGYAKRKSNELGFAAIEYGQADILELGKLGRSFDVIESSGVLHHMKDPYAGWRALLPLLRPGGFMWLGFYSEVARRDIVKARARIAQRGIGSSPDDIRRFRQEVADKGEYDTIQKSEDFFSLSTCRDLVFHAQEHRMNLGGIDAFLKEENLSFLGFDLDESVLRAYRRRFPNDPAATNLSQWDMLEMEHPDIFAAMYVFWIQKP